MLAAPALFSLFFPTGTRLNDDDTRSAVLVWSTRLVEPRFSDTESVCVCLRVPIFVSIRAFIHCSNPCAPRPRAHINKRRDARIQFSMKTLIPTPCRLGGAA